MLVSETIFDQEIIRCSTIQVSKEDVCQFDGNKPILKVPRKQIREIALAYGMPAKHPVVRVSISLVLISLGASPGFIPLMSIVLGEYITFYSLLDILAFAVPLMLIGLWPLPAIFQKRYYLLIRTVTGRKKLVFKERPSKSSLCQFLMKAEQEFGYKIKWSFGIFKINRKASPSRRPDSTPRKTRYAKNAGTLPAQFSSRPQREYPSSIFSLRRRISKKKKPGILESLIRDFASG